MNEILFLILLCPQDLFERDAALRRSLSPVVEPGPIEPKSFAVELEGRADFGCGSFDLKASFKSLFNKNMAEELLGGALSSLEAQLARSPLVLACYASPTVCDAIKHYRVSANAMLGMELDSCRALEGELQDVERRARARAIKRCLEERARRGEPLDEASRACRRSETVRGLDGRDVRAVDLVAELDLPGDLVPGLRLGSGTLRAEASATAVLQAYEKRRQACRRRWADALRDPDKATLEDLGPVGRRDLEQIAVLEPGRRETVVRSLSAVTALSELLREVHRTERVLESAEIVAAPELRAEMERRRKLLRNEMERLVEEFEMERRLNAAVSRAQSVAAAGEAVRARRRLDTRRSLERDRAAQDRLKPWGCEVRRSKR